MFELLAPAGDLEKLEIAFLYGADAVYIGGKNFSLRANATNFSNEEIKEASLSSKKYNKKLYVTINIVFHDEDFDSLYEYLKFLESINIDGVIVSDIAVIKLINDANIDLFIILSTQASVINEYSAKFFYSLGVKRIVLGRETPKEDIARIINNTKVETEVFLHGAMCSSISGKCILSNKTTLRDANRGGCAQVCRWCFTNEDKPEFSMMSKDLNMLNHVKELMDLGVISYKIEGRMRSIYYLATVVGTYRKIFDLAINNRLMQEDIYNASIVLNKVANRESKAQFFNEENSYLDQYYFGRNEVTNKDFLGLVKSYDKVNKVVTLEQRNYFKKGDKVEFINPSMNIRTLIIDEIYTEDNKLIEVANHPKMIVKLPTEFSLEENDIMRISLIN